jgi:hypothetical protein
MYLGSIIYNIGYAKKNGLEDEAYITLYNKYYEKFTNIFKGNASIK